MGLAVLGLASAASADASAAATGSPIALQGILEIIVEERHDGDHARYELVAGATRYRLRFTDHAPALLSGARVALRGMRIGNEVRLRGEDLTSLDPSSRAQADARAVGTRRIVAIPVNFTDDRREPLSPAQIHDLLFGDPSNSLDGYYREVSYGQLGFTGTVLPWIRLDIAASCGPSIAALIDAADAMVAFSAYDHVMFLYPGSPSCPFRGQATLGAVVLNTDEGPVTIGWSHIILGIVDDSVRIKEVHEIGHNLGLAHAHVLSCPHHVVEAACVRDSPPGDPFDIMSAASPGQLSALNKQRLGWQQASNALDVGATGGSFTLAPVELPTADPQTLRIPFAADTDRSYWIEHREPIGADDFVSAADAASVQVRLAEPALGNVSDFLPLANLRDVTDGAPAGSCYLDGVTPLRLEIGGRDPVRGTIEVTLRPLDAPVFLLPVHVAPIAEGDLLQLEVFARDPRRGAVTYTTSALPSGAGFWPLGDANLDGRVDTVDLQAIAGVFGRGVDTPTLVPSDVDGNGHIDAIDRDQISAIIAGTLLPTYVLAWEPTYLQAGTYPITVTATAAGGQVSSTSFEVVVGNAPVFEPIAHRTAAVGDVIGFIVNANDDQSPVTYATLPPPGAIFLPAGDLTRDGRVDGADWTYLLAAINGLTRVEQRILDLDDDRDFDYDDFVLFEALTAGRSSRRAWVFVLDLTGASPGELPVAFAAINAQNVADFQAALITISAHRIDDFLFYSALPSGAPFDRTGVLTDRFGTTPFVARRLEDVGLPAAAAQVSPRDPDTHLVAYDLRVASGAPRHIRRTNLQVVNSLGTISLDTIRPRQLLVPASFAIGAAPPPPPFAAHDVDHYACYAVRVSRGTPRLARDLTAQRADGFASRLYRLRKVTQLCVPASIGGGTVKSPATALLCYDVRTTGGQPRHQPVQGIEVADRFGSTGLRTQREELLCVPSIVQ